MQNMSWKLIILFVNWRNRDMGVIQKILSKAKFKDNKAEYLEIEQNDGNIIHLQNDVYRIEMRPEEFNEFATHVILGANKLIEMKNIKMESDD